MIIKTISHTQSTKASIQKLIDYIFDKEKLKALDTGNNPLIVKQLIRGFDMDRWAEQFKNNDDKRTFNHARRTVLRHEVMSFSPKSTPYLNDTTLKILAKGYLKQRSPDSLGVCGVHWEDGRNPHIHFVISGVSIHGKSTRISKKDFTKFKQRFQEFQMEHFPELSDSIVDHSKKKVRT